MNIDESPIDERVLLIVILSSMFVMLLGTIKKQQKVAEVVEAETVESEANGAEDESTTVEMNIEPQSLPENENETDQT